MRNKAKQWTAVEDAVLREFYSVKTNSEIADLLGRTKSSVASRAIRMGVRCRKFWTEDEDKQLIELYETTDTEELAVMLGKTVRSIYVRTNLMGLKKSKEYIAERSREIANRPDHAGRKYRFEKGHKPHNTGRLQSEYMSPEAIERTKATRFKKGHTPVNHEKVGYEVVRSDGYVWVKIQEPDKYKMKHRITWEQHHGTIPKGFNVQFKDGNRLNTDIDNLYIISRASQMANENSLHRYPEELKTAIRMVSKLNKTIRQHG